MTPLSDAERGAFIAAARSLVGVPFKHCGRTRAGIDCIGLVRFALLAVGHEVADDRKYGRHPEPEGLRLQATLRAHFGEPVSGFQPGDVVLMRWAKLPNHVAVVGDYPYGGLSLIHAVAQERRVVEHRLAGVWPGRILEGYRP